jgi:5-bromo-4-chloroindolyl phosphate hydrolysis protein
MRNRYYEIWVGCGTFSVVVSILLTVLTVLVCQVLLRVCIVCIIVALATSIEWHKEAMEIQKSQMHSNMGLLRRA